MSRLAKLLLVTLAAGLAAFGASYWFSVTPVRTMMYRQNPGMDWLRREYHLDDAQFAIINRLHEDYFPKCAKMCDRVAAQRGTVLKLSSANQGMTPELAAALRDMASLETECRSAMMTHVYTVAAAMNPADGRRYVEAMARDVVSAPDTSAARP